MNGDGNSMLDGIIIFAIKNELSKFFTNSKILQIFQIDKYTITLKLKPEINRMTSSVKERNRNFFLYLSIHPSFPKLFFSTERPSITINSPFLNSLHSNLEGGKIILIEQQNFDRVLHFIIKPFSRFGKIQNRALIAEYMGKHSNIILIREDSIIENSIKLVPSEINRFREIIPGSIYAPPPVQDKLNPLKTCKHVFQNLLDNSQSQNNPLWKILQNNFRGLGRKNAMEIVCHAGISPYISFAEATAKDIENLWISFNKIFSNLREFNLSPKVFVSPETKGGITYSIFDTTQDFNDKKHHFNDINSCLSYYYKEFSLKKELTSLQNELSKIFNKILNRTKEKIEQYKSKMDEIEQCEKYRQYGELLKSNLHLIKRGKTSVNLHNYFSSEQDLIAVPLDKSLSPLGNAQRYFKKYRKVKGSYQTITKYLRKHSADYERITHLQQKYIRGYSKYSEILVIKQQLVNLGYIKEFKKSIKKKSRKETLLPSKYISREGWIIFVGKNSKQNDMLTLKIASGNDTWLHVKNLFGSHVVIKNKGTGQTPPLDTLIEAANLSVYYSKARKENKVQVDYTLKKYVKKPRHAKPGMVIYSQEKTLYISLDMEIVNKILSRKVF